MSKFDDTVRQTITKDWQSNSQRIVRQNDFKSKTQSVSGLILNNATTVNSGVVEIAKLDDISSDRLGSDSGAVLVPDINLYKALKHDIFNYINSKLPPNLIFPESVVESINGKFGIINLINSDTIRIQNEVDGLKILVNESTVLIKENTIAWDPIHPENPVNKRYVDAKTKKFILLLPNVFNYTIPFSEHGIIQPTNINIYDTQNKEISIEFNINSNFDVYINSNISLLNHKLIIF
jgi:hypothetical protein